ncbi:hypothetical protein EIN_532510 [Entamoeba invadens IP1]|uniref:Furin repeat-containing protein n=1 Tax=Entamoeba invadens IP1 TaxID=370355 RepID=L7FNQ7_ENTIV|nr:hypothetical protein EIN_532510 [Entamoeba invadens IP1]ELP88731.1 hypothetical protein EIN_532510 [Entamoeba invadens IP1]|eukprot:XP_004255502.1 hypothetical protein EIN_532510 [Entamoeba invadens IP1]
MNGNKCDDCATGKITKDDKCDTSTNACGNKCATCEEVIGNPTAKCTKCATTTDYINLDETCAKTCKTGKVNKDTKKCEECTISGCEICETVGTIEQCTNCKNKYIAADKLLCVDLCTTGKPVETPIKKCDLCVTANCDVCDKDDNCTKCNTKFNLVSDTLKCVDICPEGYMTDKTNKNVLNVPLKVVQLVKRQMNALPVWQNTSWRKEYVTEHMP